MRAGEDILCGGVTTAQSAVALFDYTGREKGVFCLLQGWLVRDQVSDSRWASMDL